MCPENTAMFSLGTNESIRQANKVHINYCWLGVQFYAPIECTSCNTFIPENGAEGSDGFGCFNILPSLFHSLCLSVKKERERERESERERE